MRVTAAKDGVLIRRRLRIFAAAAALVLLCAVCVGGVSGADVWDGETKTKPNMVNGVCQISTGAELAYVAERVNDGDPLYVSASYKLTADIDLGGHEWTPIGSSSSKPFSGTFDGMWHSISNYEVHGVNKVCGLFGCVSGTICNLYVFDADLYPNAGNSYIGSIIGHLLDRGSVKQCAVVGSNPTSHDNSKGTYFGGMIGYMEDMATLDDWSVEDINRPAGNFGGHFGVVVGNYPNLGASDGKVEDKRVAYDIKVHEVQLIGDYPNELETDVLISTTTLYSTAGSTVKAVYTLNDGYYVDESRSTLSGTIPMDESKITLTVYLKQIAYVITIPDSLEISEDSKSGAMRISADRLWIPKGSSVRITVSSEHNLHLAYSIDSQILLPYVLSVGGVSIPNGGVVKGFTTTDSAAASLMATVPGAPLYSGTYVDRLTFTAQYIEPRQTA